ncbi:CGNR zinc finger domain-containing protein [Streptomyces sp. NPDC093085]|uniref:CGNR zinc finger domain-containing protein n=1 Tax=Streptomyces sp. NPDC093085 TaxID=3155068 RepID=UPI0034480E3D
MEHSLSVRASAERTVALVNALTGQGDTGTRPASPGSDPASVPHPASVPDPDAIARVLLAHGEPAPVELTVDDVAEMNAAAVRLREVFAAPGLAAAATALNRLLGGGAGPLRLSSHGGRTAWHPHLDSDDEAPWGEWLLGASCLALTVLLWDHQRPPGGLCASPACRNVFLTLGGGPPRRYCSRRCATRERVAAHRRAARTA